MTKCLKNADGSKMTKNRQKWLKNAKNASKMLKIAQKCNFFSFSTRRFAVALQLLELSLRLRLQVFGYQYMVSGYKYKGCKCEDAI